MNPVFVQAMSAGTAAALLCVLLFAWWAIKRQTRRRFKRKRR